MDYECDVGFVATANWYGDRCIRNKTLDEFDPWAIPKNCKPGHTYMRTKGYVKISDDECVGGENKSFEPDQVIFIQNTYTHYAKNCFRFFYFLLIRDTNFMLVVFMYSKN